MGLRELVVSEGVLRQSLANGWSRLAIHTFLQGLTGWDVGAISFMWGESGGNAVSFGATPATVLGDPSLSFERLEKS